MPTVASRFSKRGDTWEPVTGRACDANGPVNLVGATLRFLAKASVGATEVIIDSDTPAHGECINVEDVDGPGADAPFEWPVGSGNFIDIPENRGRYRFEPATAAVSQAGLYQIELEATLSGGKVITFPGKAADNPSWQIDPDIA